MLTKEECIKALQKIEDGFGCDMAYYDLHIERDTLGQLIDEHFELQLTVNECDLIILGLMKLENELGWDVTLLIKKILKHKYISPSTKGVVECVEID